MFYNEDLLCISINYILSKNYQIAFTKIYFYVHSNRAEVLKWKVP